MSKAKRRAQEQRRAAYVTERAADALADFILADAELRGHRPTPDTSVRPEPPRAGRRTTPSA